MSFVKCPFCAGHYAVSSEAAAAIENMIAGYLDFYDDHSPLATEMHNIRNAILNTAERIDVDPLLA